jgi:dynein regulatory complex protein 1
MKSTYQLNNEKLEFNFRLLGEREFEHTQLIQQQKKKINRLQDMLSTLKAKYTRTDKKYRFAIQISCFD